MSTTYFKAVPKADPSATRFFCAPSDALMSKVEQAVSRRFGVSPPVVVSELDKFPVGVKIVVLSSSEVC